MTRKPWWLIFRSWVLVSLVSGAAAATLPVRGEIRERSGIARHNSLLEQGVPIAPLPEREARRLVLRGAQGIVEPEARDENGNVRWVRVSARVSMPAGGRVPVTVEAGQGETPRRTIEVTRTTEGISAQTPDYRLTVRPGGDIELSAGAKPLLKGNWGVEVVADARGILWGTNLAAFTPSAIDVEEQSPTRATLVLRAFMGKNQRKEPTVSEPGRRMEFELRFFVNALSPSLRFAWRLTNVTGYKTWLQRYALRLPLAGPAEVVRESPADRLLLSMPGGRVAMTAGFVADLGKGAGIRLGDSGMDVIVGGLDMPQDGAMFAGPAPDIHRLFYDGMSRTFEGSLVTTGSLTDAAEELAPLDLVLPAQYYSDVKALPEQGDPVTFGEFENPVKLAAEWLLKNQWRGMLWWGEWYREWDETRNMAVEEAGNGHSPLAPLYHYWRTGDARFLDCARRSFQYVWDVQLSKSEERQGRMFHTRRHLFDELDWIHPRYQRATGGLISSHVFLNPAARREIVATIRSFHQHMFDDKGVPHGWDKVRNRRDATEDGVDTSNFMEALSMCYRETGDRTFLDWALQMSRWTAARYEIRGKRENDDWNWNLTNYVLRGLVTLYETCHDPQVRDLAMDMSRRTLANTSRDGMALKDGIGGGELHFVFYHAWISTRVAKIAPDGDAMTRTLLMMVRREIERQRADGTSALKPAASGGMPTTWHSYYDAKALVAYVPVLAAHLARSQ
jgi:hypothetical protein